MGSSNYTRGLTLGLFLAGAFQAGCATALGPGFAHNTREISIAAPAGSDSLLHVRVVDRLKNNGDRPISYLDVDLPEGSSTNAGSPAFHSDGNELQAVQLGPGGPWRVRFNAAMPVGHRQTVIVDYDLHSFYSSQGAIGIDRDHFYVADRAAFPTWRTPVGIFATGDRHAVAESIEVSAPTDFRVMASGRAQKTARNGAVAVHEFRQRRWYESPFAIAGRYQQQQIKTAQGKVVFWTLQPPDAQQERAAAQRLAAAADTYRMIFGPATKHAWTVHVVEALDNAPQRAPDGMEAASFPRGVLIGEGSASAQGIAGDAVLDRAEYELAQVWFAWHARSSPDSRALLDDGLSWYAVTRAALARGGASARQAGIARLLAAYDNARQREESDPPKSAFTKSALTPSDRQRASAAYHGALFLVALEDAVGRENFDSAVRRVLLAAKSSEVDVNDLRSALESSSGRDLDAMFRTWRDDSKLPDEFRARYAAHAAGNSHSEVVAGGAP